MGLRLAAIVLLLCCGCSSNYKIQSRNQESTAMVQAILAEQHRVNAVLDAYKTYLAKGRDKQVEMGFDADGKMTSMIIYSQPRILDPKIPGINTLLSNRDFPVLKPDEGQWSWPLFFDGIKPLTYLLPIGDALKTFWSEAYTAK